MHSMSSRRVSPRLSSRPPRSSQTPVTTTSSPRRQFGGARARLAHVAALARGVEHPHEPREPQARRRQLLQRVHEREFAGPGLGVAHVDERVRLPDLVGDAHVVGARRPRAQRREEPEPERHRLQLPGLLEGRRRVELLGVGAPGDRLPELLAEV